MSRSHKRTLIFKDKNKDCQREANRRIRRLPIGEELNNCGYKKQYPQYNISDYYFTAEEPVEKMSRRKRGVFYDK